MKTVKHNTGIIQEVNDTGIYTQKDYGYVIPTHSDYGGQLGIDKKKAIPMVIDPDDTQRSIIIDRARLNHSIINEAINDTTNASDAFARMAKIQEVSVTKLKMDQPGITASARPKQVVNRYAEKSFRRKIESNSKIAAAENTTLEPVKKTRTRSKPEVVQLAEPAYEPEQTDTSQTVADDVLTEKIIDVLQNLLPQILGADKESPVQSDPSVVEPETVSEPQQDTATSSVVPPSFILSLAPVDVTTSMAMGVSLKFHDIIITHNAVICVYRTDFEYGDRLAPPGTPKDVYAATICKRGSDKPISEGLDDSTFMLSYLGVKFTYDHNEFSIFIRRASAPKESE